MALKINQTGKIISRVLGWALTIVLAVVVVRLFIWEQSYYHDKSVEKRASAEPVLSEIARNPLPDETKPDAQAIAQYQTDAKEPRYLIIERLDVKARVYRSDAGTNILAVPNNIYDAMWFSGSGTPGQGRGIVIAGLEHGATADGIFKNLAGLENGDRITIETGDGNRSDYRISEVKLVATDGLKDALRTAQRPLNHQETLSLITVPPSDGDYRSVGFVRAELASF